MKEGCPRNSRMSKGSSRHVQLCERDMKGGSRDVLGIPGCPRDPLDSMGSCVTGTPREDPGMSKGFSEHHGSLLRGT